MACVLWSGGFAAAHFVNTYLWKRPITEILAPLAGAISDDAVILARTKVAWAIPTFAGKVVSLQHANPLVADMAQRNQDVVLFFDPATTNKKRIGILKRYNVSHVLIGVAEPDIRREPVNTPENVMKFLTLVGSVKGQGDDYILVKLDNLLSRDEEKWQLSP